MNWEKQLKKNWYLRRHCDYYKNQFIQASSRAQCENFGCYKCSYTEHCDFSIGALLSIHSWGKNFEHPNREVSPAQRAAVKAYLAR